MAAHAPLPPSSAARWGAQCPGSASLEAASTLPANEAHAESAAWGEAAHWLAAEWLRHGPAAFTGMRAPNGLTVEEEMVEAAAVYVEDVLNCGTPGFDWHIEERVDCITIHADNWGTPDLWQFTPKGNGGLLLIWDPKFGHRFVDAFENWQMIDYAAGILARPEFRNLDHRQVQVVMTIVQPRNYHPSGPVRRWTVSALDLADYWQRLRDAADEAASLEPPVRVGDECHDCKARHNCPALHAIAGRIADTAASATPLDLPPVALGIELRTLRHAQTLLDARVTGLEAQALGLIRSGKRVPFFALEQGTGRERWTVDTDTVRATLGDAALSPAKPLTPRQARQALGPNAVILVNALSTRPPGPFNLVAVSDDAASRVFQKPTGAVNG